MWEHVLESKVDDMIGFLSREEDRNRLREFNDKLLNCFNEFVAKMHAYRDTIANELQQSNPEVSFDDIPLGTFIQKAREVLKDEHPFLLTALIMHKREQTSLHSIMKDYFVRSVHKDLTSIKKMLGCPDLEFVSRVELRRRAKLLGQQQTEEVVDDSNQEEEDN